MAFTLQTAKRSAASAKIAIAGPSGSGKTLSSLLFAYGVLKKRHPDWSDAEIFSKIAVIDTENHSASLYSGLEMYGVKIEGYQVVDFAPPFSPQNYIEAIDVVERAGMEFLILDSASHAWVGVGGSLDSQGKIAERGGSSWAAWRNVTPQHNKFVDKVLQSPLDVIMCFRAKMEYEQIEENGRKKVRAIGYGLQFREGIEYELQTCFMLSYDHSAEATKDRTHMFDNQIFTITPETGMKYYEWLKGDGSAPAPEKPKPQLKPATPAPQPEPEPEASEPLPEVTMEEVDAVIRAAVAAQGKEPVFERVKSIAGVKNYTKVTDPVILSKLYEAFKEE